MTSTPPLGDPTISGSANSAALAWTTSWGDATWVLGLSLTPKAAVCRAVSAVTPRTRPGASPCGDGDPPHAHAGLCGSPTRRHTHASPPTFSAQTQAGPGAPQPHQPPAPGASESRAPQTTWPLFGYRGWGWTRGGSFSGYVRRCRVLGGTQTGPQSDNKLGGILRLLSGWSQGRVPSGAPRATSSCPAQPARKAGSRTDVTLAGSQLSSCRFS